MGGVAQLHAFGTTFDGQTAFPGIRRLGRAALYRARRTPERWESTEEVYFTPVVEPAEHRGIDHDTIESFRAAVRKLLKKSGGDIVSTLSGGLDSRTIAATLAAENADIPFATHAVHEGHDLGVARKVAAALGRPHRTVRLPATLPLDGRADAFCGASNGALLQNHFLRFVSPYYDREYVSVVSRMSERRRWMQHPQRTIIRALAPALSRIPRAYSDVLTWPVDNPFLLRVPVAMERVYRMAGISRFPKLHRSLSRHAPTLGYAFSITEANAEMGENPCPALSLAHLTFPSDIRTFP